MLNKHKLKKKKKIIKTIKQTLDATAKMGIYP